MDFNRYKFFTRCLLLSGFFFFCTDPVPAGQTNLADTLSIDALKKWSLDELMTIDVTTVSKRPERWLDAPAAVSVITREDIRRSGAQKLPDLLRLANNLHVAQKGAHQWGISSRGFNTDLSNKLLVLIDGRTVYTPLYSGVFWERQDYLLDDIDRIEIVSGPGSTLWGANAVNGVINIITKPSAETQGIYLEGGTETSLRGFIGARYGGTIGSETTYRIYSQYRDHPEEKFSNGNGALDSWQIKQGGIRIDGRTSTDGSFTLQGDAYITDQNSSSGGSSVSGGNILGRFEYILSVNSDITVQAYYDRTQLYLPSPPLVINGTPFTPSGVFKDNLDTYDLDVRHRWMWSEHNVLVWGAGYRFTHDEVSNSPALGFFPEKLDQHLFNSFVQNETDMLTELLLTLGTKFEHNDYTGWEIEPSVRLQWIASESQMFWSAISRAVRMPSRIDREISQPAAPYYLFPPNIQLLIGGKNFKSETVVAYEIGYRAHWGEELTASISAFYNQYDNLRSTSLSPGTIFPLFFENNLEGDTYGIEVGTKYKLSDKWLVQADYTFLKAKIRIEEGKTDFNKALNETSDPQQQFLFRSSLNILENFELDCTVRWVDMLHNYNGSTEGSVPSYVEADIHIGWNISQTIRVSLAGWNLLNNHHPEYGFPQPSRPEITRKLFGKVSYSL